MWNLGHRGHTKAAIIFGLSAILAGCADTPETIEDGGSLNEKIVATKPKSTTPVQGQSIEIIHQIEFAPNEIFDFKDIPKRKIKTPSGDVYIADHRQNPRYLKLIQEWLDYSQRASNTKNNDTQINYYNEIGKPLLRIKYIQINDVMRAGCLEMVDSDCNLSTYYYKKSCGDEHNYGSNVLSQCERNNYEWISRRTIQMTSCMIDGKMHHTEAALTLRTVPEIAENNLKFMCLNWRN